MTEKDMNVSTDNARQAGLTDQAIVELARRHNIHTVDGWNIFVHERHAGHDAVVQFAHAVIADFLDRAGQYVTNDASREAAIADALAAHSADARNGEGVALAQEMRWRDVSVEKPTQAQQVLFVRNGKVHFGAWINDIFWYSNEKVCALYWMPLPEAPTLVAPAAPAPKCATCNDNGMIGGPSYYAPDEGGEPCPDCATPAPAAQAEPFGFASPTQGNYFTRNKTIADRIGGLIPVYASPQHQSGEEGADARDAAAYRRINTPEITDFLTAVHNEALHQRERWGAEGDAGKTDADWFWLLGYLGGKAMRAENIEKLLHHIITTAAACLNWHAARVGHYTDMRPGIDAAMADQACGPVTKDES